MFKIHEIEKIKFRMKQKAPPRFERAIFMLVTEYGNHYATSIQQFS